MSHETSVIRSFCQHFINILPFLACITLIYGSHTICLDLMHGYDVDAYMILLRTSQCAAFVAPASIYLVCVVGSGPVLLVGACFTMLGILIPSHVEDLWKQKITFAVLYGSGVSVMFQATFVAVSSIFRKNIVCSFLMLGLVAATMTSTQHLFELSVTKFAKCTMIGLLTLILITCICPAFLITAGTRTCKKTDKKDMFEPLLIGDTNNDQKVLAEKEILKTSFIVEVCTLTTETHIEDKANNTTDDWTKNDFLRRVCVLLFWATGVHFSFLLNNREWSTSVRLLLLTCIFSLIAFWLQKTSLTGRKSEVNHVASDRACNYFMLGLVGVGTLVLQIFPLLTDVRYYSLLFSMGFLYQLKDNMPQDTRDVSWLINYVCGELVFSLCALFLGYLPSYIVCCLTVAPVATNIYIQDFCVLAIPLAMILLSLRYRIRSESTIPKT